MIIIFGGTSEGRQLAKVCDFGKVEAKICVATEYGSDVLKESQYVKICQGRMDAAEMATFLQKKDQDLSWTPPIPMRKKLQRISKQSVSR